MKLWIDDVRPAPEGWFWVKTVNEAQAAIITCELLNSTNVFIDEVELISLDHDAGDYGPPDYIKVLDWLEETGRNYPIRIHSANVVGVQNMRRIIQRNGWKEIK